MAEERVESREEKPTLRRIRAGSLAEEAYRVIRASIIEGEFGPGERLVETRLAEELGVSRAPVREALKKLSEEHLVVEKPRRGTFVREFTAKDFVDIYNLLSAIEILAVRLIHRNGVPLNALEKTVEEMRRAAEAGDFGRVVATELRFHEELCALADNRFLSSAFRSLSGPVGMALSLHDATYEDLVDVAREHYPLLEKIRRGTEVEAVYAVCTHIQASPGGVMTRLGGNPADILEPLVKPQGAEEDA
jgi:DNA-binding GntR family transcriptional regulator